ncbi:hypothetical protein CsSME_00026262 [Camellia sinensis var. sinensis]
MQKLSALTSEGRRLTRRADVSESTEGHREDSIAMSCSVVAACILFWGVVIAKETYFYYFASDIVLTHILHYFQLLSYSPQDCFLLCLMSRLLRSCAL